MIDENSVPADTEIITGSHFHGGAQMFRAHRLPQNQKSVMKTVSNPTLKSSLDPSSTAGPEIFTAYTLTQNQK